MVGEFCSLVSSEVVQDSKGSSFLACGRWTISHINKCSRRKRWKVNRGSRLHRSSPRVDISLLTSITTPKTPQATHHGGRQHPRDLWRDVCIASPLNIILSDINCRPQAEYTTESLKPGHDEKPRKASVFQDESRRKASVAALTQNVTGESVAYPTYSFKC